MSQPLEFENVSYNSPGGAFDAKSSTQKIGFYGVAPVTRPITASTSQISTTVGQSTSTAGGATTSWGFKSQVELTNLITAVSSIQLTLKALGLMAGGVDPLITRQTRTWEQLDYSAPDGAVYGRTSTDLISFYLATPIARTVTTTLNISTTTTVSLSTIGTATTSWGFATVTEVAAICTVVSTAQLQLKKLGLMV
jgi:hypothetical protein